METRATAGASPRVNTNRAENVVSGGLTARAARTSLLADGTVHLARWIPLRMAHRIGQMPRGGKGLGY
jgi:hypothetical protein